MLRILHGRMGGCVYGNTLNMLKGKPFVTFTFKTKVHRLDRISETRNNRKMVSSERRWSHIL